MGDEGRFAAPLSLQAESWLESILVGSEFRLAGIYKRSFSLLRGAFDIPLTERLRALSSFSFRYESLQSMSSDRGTSISEASACCAKR